jgi:phosphoribosyl-ATP pyrophosphohydrolase/phosphoribosyl-AMP cyclohydrolase
MQVKWDERGLCVAVAQDRLTGRVQMVAWMNAESLQKTLDTRKATFFSRSRNKLWTKGEESGHVLHVSDVRIDCDGDTILVLVDPDGPSCHTGKDTCFFRDAEGSEGEIGEPLLEALGREIESRKSSDAGKSYTKSLLDGGAPKIGGKLREEADELARALEGETPERVASEAADVLYHLMVGLASRGVTFRAVLSELSRRRGTSGHDEKRSRK